MPSSTTRPLIGLISIFALLPGAWMIGNGIAHEDLPVHLLGVVIGIGYTFSTLADLRRAWIVRSISSAGFGCLSVWLMIFGISLVLASIPRFFSPGLPPLAALILVAFAATGLAMIRAGWRFASRADAELEKHATP